MKLFIYKLHIHSAEKASWDQQIGKYLVEKVRNAAHLETTTIVYCSTLFYGYSGWAWRSALSKHYLSW